MSTPSPDEQVTFLVNLQRLLNEGNFTATYKYALLLAIADLCVEKGDDSSAPLRLTTEDLATKFIELYWRQAAPYVPVAARPTMGSDIDGMTAREPAPTYGAGRGQLDAFVLQQNTGKQAAIINAIARERSACVGSLATVRAMPSAWRTLVRDVAATVQTMPLWKLQTLGRERLEFLYVAGPSTKEIQLLSGVAFCFRRFHALVRDLVQASWVRFVRRLPENAVVLGEAHELGDFLFGAERSSLDAYRPILRDVQHDDCFYCERPMHGRGDVDHFVPWSRYSLDLGHNFVLAHSACNGNKADRLAATEHLARWCDRNVDERGKLQQQLDHAKLLNDRAATWQVTRWAYAQAEAAHAQVWLDGKDGLTHLSPDWRSFVDDAEGRSSQDRTALVD